MATENTTDIKHKAIEELLKAINILSRRSHEKVPTNIAQLAEESIGVSSPIIEWENLGSILQIGKDIGLPLNVRWFNVESIFSQDSSIIFPMLLCIQNNDKIRLVAIMRRKGDSLLLQYIDSVEQEWIKRSDFKQRIILLSSGEKEATKRLNNAKETLYLYSVQDSDIDVFLKTHSVQELIRVADFAKLLNTDFQPKCEFTKRVIAEPILWTALSSAQPTMTQHTTDTLGGFHAVIAEDYIDYISASDRTHHDTHHDKHDNERLSILKRFQSRPIRKLIRLINLERKDILVLCGYGLLISFMSLVTPLAIDALVNTISAGTVTLPLIVLSAIVFVALLFSGSFTLLQEYVVEIMKQRIFVNTAFEIAHKLPHAKQVFFSDEYAPELVNRFFDIVTLQKTLSKLLLDGISAFLLAIAGLFLLAFFSPLLLGLGVLLLFTTFILIIVVGRGGLRTSINESHEKYLIAASLEEVGRCLTSFKLVASPRLLYNKIDELLSAYVKYRNEHFRVILRQLTVAIFLKILISVSVLIVGGALVIDRQISLGQLVASQIVILYLISGVENLFKQLETVYDMLTSLEKVSQITDIDLERIGGTVIPKRENGLKVSFHDVVYGYDVSPVLNKLSITIHPGERVCLAGKSGEGKSTIASLILGLDYANSGTVLLDEFDVRSTNLQSIRTSVAIAIAEDEIIEGTIYDNIVLGREWITPADVLWVLQIVRLEESLLKLPKGLLTRLVSHGKNLSTGQIRRIMLARAIVARPRLLILDESFNGIEEYIKLEIMQELYSKQHSWSILSITHDPEIVNFADKIILIEKGCVVEEGSLHDLAIKGTKFALLFPEIVSEHAAKS